MPRGEVDITRLERLVSHALVLLLLSMAVLPGLEAPRTVARNNPTLSPQPTSASAAIDPALNRGTTSTRRSIYATPIPLPTIEPSATPLPTPVAIDLSATPLPAPVVATPEPTPMPTPVPTPVPGPFLSWPTTGTISQYFTGGHYAIDIANVCGTPVVAAREGVITYAGWKDNGGGFVIDIDHGAGVMTSYNHLSAVAVGYGQQVDRGQYIGAIGSTGNSTGCHLHFALLTNGYWDNPLLYL